MSTEPSKATRRVVLTRCAFTCELCARQARGGQIHHRQPRAMGGSRNPAINHASNLVLLCPDCHRFIETSRREQAYRYGWLVRRGHDPAETPYLLYGRWVLLTSDGQYVPYNPGTEETTDDGHDG